MTAETNPDSHRLPAPRVRDFNGEMMRLARGSQGCTQSELADKLKVSQSKVAKWEDGLLSPSQEELESAAAELQFPIEFFRQSDEVHGFGTCCLYHRKQQSLPTKTLNMIHDQINVIAMGVSRLVRNVSLSPRYEFPQMDVDEYGTPESVAKLVRAAWRLPYGPIRNLVYCIESAGGIVIPSSFGTEKLCAVSLWPRGMPPLFFVNRDMPADRCRWSLAHEAAHIVMHRIPTPNAEREADAFASEFLLPARDVAPDLDGLTLAGAARLKSKWRVAMQALINRARDLNKISVRQHRSFFQRISALGYRKNEPQPIEGETPETLNSLVDYHIQKLGYSTDDLCRLLFCRTEEQLCRRFNRPEGKQFRVFDDSM